MAELNELIEELVTANRILARENVVDSSAISVCAIPPIRNAICFHARGRPTASRVTTSWSSRWTGRPVDARGRAPYLERFIHGALYEARPDVMSVVHHHSESVIPFGVTGMPIRPIFHMGASIGHEVPVWDSHDHFGDTALLVENMDMGRDLAKHAAGRHRAHARPRRDGCGRDHSSRGLCFGLSGGECAPSETGHGHVRDDIKFLTPGEVDKVVTRTGSYGIKRAWENWCRRAWRPFRPEQN